MPYWSPNCSIYKAYSLTGSPNLDKGQEHTKKVIFKKEEFKDAHPLHNLRTSDSSINGEIGWI
jgi:hypothetical protein